MNPETKTCKNCKASFIIAPEDFDFYKKIQVPPPTFCPECRLQRRLAFRNERALYKRTCDLCDKPLIGAYQEGTAFPVYCSSCWWGDRWSGAEHATDYDPSRPFLAQLKELQAGVPRPNMNNYAGSTLINSDYTNCSGEMKNCYLVFGALNDEDCAYGHYITDCKDCIDVLYGTKNEHCYECLDIENCYELSYSQSCTDCRNSQFLFDCRNCSDCIGCVGLRNKQYHILNIGYSKEEYQKRKTALALDTRSGREAFEKEYRKIYYLLPRKYYHGQMNKGFSGDYISNTENTLDSFYVKDTRGCRFMFWCIHARDVYDYFSWGDSELSYECVSTGDKNYRSLFTDTSWSDNKDVEYSSLCFNSSFLFGCIGLRNKKYCILNKQYSEEDYRKVRAQIIENMTTMPYADAQGILYPYGEFLPIELSPFPYNDSVAQEHFPLTKESAAGRGFRWTDEAPREYRITLRTEAIPDNAAAIGDSAVNEVIQCAHKGECGDRCTVAFKLIPHEVQFYKKYGVPMPTLCHNCRHAARVIMRNPLKLWERDCQCQGKASQENAYKNASSHFHGDGACPNRFETSYAPDRPEIVYCEQCYNAEIV